MLRKEKTDYEVISFFAEIACISVDLLSNRVFTPPRVSLYTFITERPASHLNMSVYFRKLQYQVAIVQEFRSNFMVERSGITERGRSPNGGIPLRRSVKRRRFGRVLFQTAPPEYGNQGFFVAARSSGRQNEECHPDGNRKCFYLSE